MLSMLQGKKILLGVTGSIAAYKAALVTRLLVKEGVEVRVIMTQAATSFITPLTLSTLSRNQVLLDFSDQDQWNNHVLLGQWADVMLIAPASVNTLAKMTAGVCDNLLLAVYLSAHCPVVFAPAMDSDMWHHPATKENIRKLIKRGHTQLPVGSGELASGLTGEGRMQEPGDIVAFLQDFMEHPEEDLAGRTALVTAGPTYEPLDPVRFIGNHASGKMGVAIAEALALRGATVNLVLGPSTLEPSFPHLNLHRVTTASDMREACLKLFPGSDITVMAAAVADYRPRDPQNQKIKKKEDTLTLTLEKTTDILGELGRRKKAGQFLGGFALETDHEEENALKKMREKHLDMIVLNSLNDPGAGFREDTNKVTIFTGEGKKTVFPLKSKTEVAKDIVRLVVASRNGPTK